MLTIVLCMRICVDTAQLKVDPETAGPRLEGVPLRISTLDENALEEAVRLKEKHGGKLVALALVPFAPPREIVLKALAMGADEAYLIEDPTSVNADALATATVLSAALRKLEGWQLVICGDGSIDQYSRQVGPRLAEALGVPALTQVVRVEIDDRRIVVRRALEECTETVEADLPVVLTVGQEINQPRLPTVLQIMGASKKPTVEWRLQDLGVSPDVTTASLSAVTTLNVFAPATDRKRIAIRGEDTEEVARNLARILFEEGLANPR